MPAKEIWEYRDLILLLFRRDLVAVYKQTVLGPIWFFMGPLFTVAVYTLVFGRVARLPSDGVPPPIFYMSGILLWSFFSSNLTAITGSLVQNASLFGKVYFPRLVVPLSIIMSSLVKLGIQSLMLALILFYFIVFQNYTWNPSFVLCLLPILLLILAAIALGLGLFFASLSTRYRDLNHLVGFGVLLLMYASPVIYPTSFVPDSLLFLLTLLRPSLKDLKRGYLVWIFRIGGGFFTAFVLHLEVYSLGLWPFIAWKGNLLILFEL